MSLVDAETRRLQIETRRMEIEDARAERSQSLRRFCLDHAMSNSGHLTHDAELVVTFAAALERYVLNGSISVESAEVSAA